MPIHSNLSLSERWSSENFSEMARLWSLSRDDQVKMRQLQQRIADLDHWKNDPFEVIRYYKQCKASLTKTEKMWRHMVSWRLTEDMDSFLTRYQPDEMWHQLPNQMLATTDYEGDPIVVDRVGVADSWGLFKHFGEETMADHLIYIRELYTSPDFWKQHYEPQQGHKVRQYNMIVDLDDLNQGPLKPSLLRVLQRVSRILQDCYTGWEKRIFVIRAPAVFKMAWRLVKYFFDQEKRDAIIFATKSDYLDVLGKYMDLRDLPDIIAPGIGQAKGYPGTYFERVSLQGGPIRKDKLLERQQEEDATEECTSSSFDFDSHRGGAAAANINVKVMTKGVWSRAGPNRGATTVTTTYTSSTCKGTF
ncbi:SEC14-like protein 5 [Seminavis robusta]|uniref:SEC14-like protein 5 n=1 Tax=Seminavis robusta TaxID=568900 RepID=A0A9N8HD90_9STRA|nr:SEC14-like protein 5 [Seminavis robusta]|eukprot:Sro414_g138400.1 SEC14-like protein 5 (361) ;mRNA; f:65393-66567